MFKSIWDDIVYQFRQGSVFTVLIGICVAVFLVFETLRLILWSGGHLPQYEYIYDLFALSARTSTFIRHPWSLITFMFMHADVWHIFFNMLSLYWFGEIYQLYMRDRRALAVFMGGSMAGGLLFILLSNIIPPLRASIDIPLVGASAGILSILFATTALNPDHRINILLIGPVPIKYLSIVFFLISFAAIAHGNAGGEISHIGGAIFGFAYIKSLQSGVDWFTPFDKITGLFQPKSKLKATYVNNGKNKKDEPTDSEQKRVDAILDKIAKSGYNSLSKEEKDFLFKFSNK